MNTRTCFCNTPFLTENSNKHCFEQIFSIITSTSKLSSAFKLHVITALWPRIDRSCQMTGEASIYKDNSARVTQTWSAGQSAKVKKTGRYPYRPVRNSAWGKDTRQTHYPEWERSTVAALSESRTFRHEKHAIQGCETAMTNPLRWVFAKRSNHFGVQIQWKEPQDD